MNRLNLLGRTALAAASITLLPSAAPRQPDLKLLDFGAVKSLPPCKPAGAEKDVVAVIRIGIPKVLSVDKLENTVKHEVGKFKDDVKDDDQKLGSGKDDRGTDNTSSIGSGQPFHTYLRSLNLGTTGFVLVRVIIHKGNNFTFLDDYEKPKGNKIYIYGITIPADDESGAFCGVDTDGDNTSAKNIKRVRKFHVDLSKLQNSQKSFNIVLSPGNAPGTPIIIDPKIHDEE